MADTESNSTTTPAASATTKAGATTSEWAQTAVGAIVAILALTQSTEVQVQVAAIWAVAIMVSAYSLSRGIVKLVR
jgi:hypothetical protein